ncbi:hypothetical protein [Burkholderia ubonensis]|uniref:hypothetical protein n=1 Tax=Burkholderia ubonensis TaxID=101571 RepID=UPI000A67C5BC|nr:hypothetical protein [Burkholderia ubonensis]
MLRDDLAQRRQARADREVAVADLVGDRVGEGFVAFHRTGQEPGAASGLIVQWLLAKGKLVGLLHMVSATRAHPSRALPIDMLIGRLRSA